MESIGIVGGMSPESTVSYYLNIVRLHQAAFGDHSYPRIVISSVSFQHYIEMQHAGEWDAIAAGLQKEFAAVAAAGVDFAILATNTMHKVLPDVASPIPILSIMDVVAGYAAKHGITSIGLTGTRFTMSDGFYAQALERGGLRVIIPDEGEQSTIHSIIFDELIAGRVEPASVDAFAAVCRQLVARGAAAVLLACTELEMLTRGGGVDVVTIDTTRLHAEAAWRRATGSR